VVGGAGRRASGVQAERGESAGGRAISGPSTLSRLMMCCWVLSRSVFRPLLRGRFRSRLLRKGWMGSSVSS